MSWITELTLTLLDDDVALGLDAGAREELLVGGGATEGGALGIGEDVTEAIATGGLNGEVDVGAGEGHRDGVFSEGWETAHGNVVRGLYTSRKEGRAREVT